MQRIEPRRTRSKINDSLTVKGYLRQSLRLCFEQARSSSTLDASSDVSDKLTKRYRVRLRNLENFRLLSADPLEEESLEQILAITSEHHIYGLGTNLVSKILTVFNRNQWSVFNNRVKKTFEHFGLTVDWGATHYLSFSATIRRGLSRRGKPVVLGTRCLLSVGFARYVAQKREPRFSEVILSGSCAVIRSPD